MLRLRARVDMAAMAKEGVLHIPQSSCITGPSLSDCLVSYPGHSLEESYPPLKRCSQCILQPQPIGQKYEEDLALNYQQ